MFAHSGHIQQLYFGLGFWENDGLSPGGGEEVWSSHRSQDFILVMVLLNASEHGCVCGCFYLLIEIFSNIIDVYTYAVSVSCFFKVLLSAWAGKGRAVLGEERMEHLCVPSPVWLFDPASLALR